MNENTSKHNHVMTAASNKKLDTMKIGCLETIHTFAKLNYQNASKHIGGKFLNTSKEYLQPR